VDGGWSQCCKSLACLDSLSEASGGELPRLYEILVQLDATNCCKDVAVVGRGGDRNGGVER
jgi:hypothetical protein